MEYICIEHCIEHRCDDALLHWHIATFKIISTPQASAAQCGMRLGRPGRLIILNFNQYIDYID